jgi:hypothetical protein
MRIEKFRIQIWWERWNLKNESGFDFEPSITVTKWEALVAERFDEEEESSNMIWDTESLKSKI